MVESAVLEAKNKKAVRGSGSAGSRSRWWRSGPFTANVKKDRRQGDEMFCFLKILSEMRMLTTVYCAKNAH